MTMPQKQRKVKRKDSLADGRPINEKERKMIQGIVAGKSNYRSMIDAGYTESTAHTHATEKFKQLAPKILEMMDKAGVTDEKLILKLKDGLDALHPNFKTDDFAVQHKYLETGLKLRGHLQQDKGVDVNINIDLADRLHRARMNADMITVEAAT